MAKVLTGELMGRKQLEICFPKTEAFCNFTFLTLHILPRREPPTTGDTSAVRRLVTRKINGLVFKNTYLLNSFL